MYRIYRKIVNSFQGDFLIHEFCKKLYVFEEI